MEFNVKAMLCGRDEGVSQKNNKPWKKLRFVEKTQGDSFEVFVNDFGKFDKVYADYDIRLKLEKNYKGFWQLSLKEG